jgi:hypothetical protein
MASASAKAVALPPRRLPLSPVSTASSDVSSPFAAPGGAADGAQGASPNKAAAAAAAGSGFSSGGRGEQQQRVVSPTAVLVRSSGSLGSSCLPSPAGDSSSMSSKVSVGRMSPAGFVAGTGSKGVGLQQLVSILPPRDATEAAIDGGSMVHAHSLLSNGIGSNDSTCSSVLQGATDSYESTLQLSSSLSGPVLQPSNTSQGPLSPTYSDRPPSLGFGSGSVGKQEQRCGVAAADNPVRG